MNIHNERLRQQEEEKAREEEAELADLRRKRREEEEEAKKSKGKEKLDDSPIPSPRPLEFPELPQDPRDYEEELKAKQQQEEEDRQEKLATLNSLLDHYKRETEEAKASRKEYEMKWLEASQKISQQDELIAKLAHKGVETLPDQHMENLKEAMRHIIAGPIKTILINSW